MKKLYRIVGDDPLNQTLEFFQFFERKIKGDHVSVGGVDHKWVEKASGEIKVESVSEKIDLIWVERNNTSLYIYNHEELVLIEAFDNVGVADIRSAKEGFLFSKNIPKQWYFIYLYSGKIIHIGQKIDENYFFKNHTVDMDYKIGELYHYCRYDSEEEPNFSCKSKEGKDLNQSRNGKVTFITGQIGSQPIILMRIVVDKKTNSWERGTYYEFLNYYEGEQTVIFNFTDRNGKEKILKFKLTNKFSRTYQLVRTV